MSANPGVAEIIAERDRYREALEAIAATEPTSLAPVGGPRWVHWRKQAREALASAASEQMEAQDG